MNFSEKTLKSNIVYAGRVLTLNVDEVGLPDGSHSRREVIHHSGGAAVLFVDEGKVLLVKQFRYAYGREIFEIPAGKLNAGEAPQLAAARELEEETGYKAEIVRLAEIYPTPGYTDEIIYIFLAKNAVHTAQKLDEGEFLNVKFIPIEKVVEMIDSGEINDAKTIVAIYKYILQQK